MAHPCPHWCDGLCKVYIMFTCEHMMQFNGIFDKSINSEPWIRLSRKNFNFHRTIDADDVKNDTCCMHSIRGIL